MYQASTRNWSLSAAPGGDARGGGGSESEGEEGRGGNTQRKTRRLRENATIVTDHGERRCFCHSPPKDGGDTFIMVSEGDGRIFGPLCVCFCWSHAA